LKVYIKKGLLKASNDGNSSSEIMITKDDELLSANINTNPYLAKISVIILLLIIVGFMISEVLQFLFHTAYINIICNRISTYKKDILYCIY